MGGPINATGLAASHFKQNYTQREMSDRDRWYRFSYCFPTCLLKMYLPLFKLREIVLPTEGIALQLPRYRHKANKFTYRLFWLCAPSNGNNPKLKRLIQIRMMGPNVCINHRKPIGKYRTDTMKPLNRTWGGAIGTAHPLHTKEAPYFMTKRSLIEGPTNRSGDHPE